MTMAPNGLVNQSLFRSGIAPWIVAAILGSVILACCRLPPASFNVDSAQMNALVVGP
jgi:hypothetical protein